MANIWKDFVKQTVSAVATAGTGAFTLSTASSGYQALVAGDDAKTGYFVATEGTKWQTFFGTYTNTGTSLARTTPIDGSAGVGVNETFTTAAVVYLDLVSTIAAAMDAAQAGFVVGLNPQWTSSTVLGASAGSVYIESLRRVLTGAPADITPATPSNNTWYHIYVYNNAGTLTLEASTSAPVAFATPIGTARSKTGDTSRRYLYSARTNGSGTFWQFTCDQSGFFRWSSQNNLGATPFRVLSAGAATTSTNVDCSAIVPTTAGIIQLELVNTSSTAAGYTCIGGATASSTNYDAQVSLATGVTLITNYICPCSTSQALSYLCSAAGGVLYLDVFGFYLQR